MQDTEAARHLLAIKQLVDAIDGLGDRSGAVMLTGTGYLRPGALVCIGLNPGGEEQGHEAATIRAQLDTIQPLHNEYLTGEWGNGNRLYDPGGSPHQRRVRAMIAAFGYGMDQAFGANALPTRSRDAQGVRDDVGKAFARHGWPFLDYFLSAARPSLILCFGNGRSLSPWSLLLGCPHVAVSGEPRGIGETFRSGRRCDATFTLSGGAAFATAIVGAPHPSRFAPTDEFLAFARRHASAHGRRVGD